MDRPISGEAGVGQPPQGQRGRCRRGCLLLRPKLGLAEAAAGRVRRCKNALREPQVALHHPVGAETGEQDILPADLPLVVVRSPRGLLLGDRGLLPLTNALSGVGARVAAGGPHTLQTALPHQNPGMVHFPAGGGSGARPLMRGPLPLTRSS